MTFHPETRRRRCRVRISFVACSESSQQMMLRLGTEEVRQNVSGTHLAMGKDKYQLHLFPAQVTPDGALSMVYAIMSDIVFIVLKLDEMLDDNYMESLIGTTQPDGRMTPKMRHDIEYNLYIVVGDRAGCDQASSDGVRSIAKKLGYPYLETNTSSEVDVRSTTLEAICMYFNDRSEHQPWMPSLEMVRKRCPQLAPGKMPPPHSITVPSWWSSIKMPQNPFKTIYD
eukprot:TRINITY_DN4939_c0_g1_i1.p1 TRINITY_DN4939_c0_g1~~TRINITY_DN4939_c0_g1_i1.p1  ORF type:complete len:227 (+),score=27.39 TRINITY_DN4939_c0_g1_i1:325-1005(+)